MGCLQTTCCRCFDIDFSMENLESFKNAKIFFKIWSLERQDILEELRSIRDEIQRQAKIHKIGLTTYSTVGLVGGCLGVAGIVTAPLTFGSSLTLAGVATGVTSGVAGLTHGVVKLGIVKKNCNIAKESLKKHDKTCKKMKDLVSLLKKDIDIITADITDGYSLDTSHIKEGAKQSGGAVSVGKGITNLVQDSPALAVYIYRIAGNADEIAKVRRLGAVLDEIIPSGLKDVSKGVSKLSTEALSVLAAVGIIIDLGSLIYNAVDLAKIEKGKLCSEAEKLQKVIEQMEHEYEVLNDCFNPNHKKVN